MNFLPKSDPFDIISYISQPSHGYHGWLIAGCWPHWTVQLEL